jgi:hypothetical protein
VTTHDKAGHRAAPDDAEIQRLADEAEAGYEPDRLRQRPVDLEGYRPASCGNRRSPDYEKGRDRGGVPSSQPPPHVAALYVDPAGVYAGLPDVEIWDEKRDARLYAGPWPVVAHPPCNRWVSYGAREKRGDDGGCFAAALEAVRTWGGVLEHPARSQAWSAYDLPRPARGGWTASLLYGGLSLELDQNAYGFPTRKLTWLYCHGITPGDVHDVLRSAPRGCETLWSSERSRTPPAFRDVLLGMARTANAT